MDALEILLSEVPDGGVIRRELGSNEIAIFRKGEDIYAIDAVCPHRRGPLDEADSDNDFIITCPWHGWQFDIRTGISPTHPGRVTCYKVEKDEDRVRISRS
jgi:nitrite reductase/ring-hydroxylating ferredoxin subunit